MVPARPPVSHTPRAPSVLAPALAERQSVAGAACAPLGAREAVPNGAALSGGPASAHIRRVTLASLALTQRGGSCPDPFPSVLGAKSALSRRREWRLRADEKRSGPPARGWLRRQRKCGSYLDCLASGCGLAAMFSGVAVDTQKHAATKLNVDAGLQLRSGS